jgi:hypothetical protein
MIAFAMIEIALSCRALNYDAILRLHEQYLREE